MLSLWTADRRKCLGTLGKDTMTSQSETAIGIAKQLYDARRTLRGLNADLYAKRIPEHMAALKRIAEQRTHNSVLRAAMLVLQRMQESEATGLAKLWIMAAAVELLEPDDQTPKTR